MATTRDGRQAGMNKLGKLIKGIRCAMLTTAEAEGSLRSRPMATPRGAFDGRLWFFTRVSSHKVEDVRGDRHVNVAYADAADERYVSVSGKARLVKDQAKMKALWSRVYKEWFPRGLSDPDVALLRVEVTEAEYWDASRGEMVEVIGRAKGEGIPRGKTRPGKPAMARGRGGEPAGKPGREGERWKESRPAGGAGRRGEWMETARGARDQSKSSGISSRSR